MAEVRLGEDGTLTKTMMLDAIDIVAESQKIVQQSKMRKSGYSDADIANAVLAIDKKNKRIRVRAKMKGVSDSQLVEAVKMVVERRRKLICFLRPFRKIIPSWLLTEVPLGFVECDLPFLSFVDKFFSPLKKV